MSEKTKRQPSAATLRTRAFGRVERLRQKLAEADQTVVAAKQRYSETCEKIRSELASAQAEFEALGKAAPEA